MRKENKGLVVEQLKGYLNEYPHFYLTNIEGLDAAKTLCSVVPATRVGSSSS